MAFFVRNNLKCTPKLFAPELREKSFNPRLLGEKETSMKDYGKVARIIALCVFLPCVFVSCQTEKDLERDRRIFGMQTRLLKLEKNFHEKNEATEKSGKNLSRGLAASQSLSEEINREMQLIQGRLQTLEHFLGLDELKPDEFASKAPDQKIAVLRSDLGYVGERVDKLNQKLDTLSKTQNELFSSVENILKAAAEKKAAKVSTSSSRSSGRTPLSSLSEVEKAFEAKRYTHIVQDYAGLKKKVKREDNYDLSFFYAGSLFKLGRISDAALAFDDLLKEKKQSDKLPRIYLRLGDCFRLLGKDDVALIYYEELLDKYPKDSLAKFAKGYIEKLRKT